MLFKVFFKNLWITEACFFETSNCSLFMLFLTKFVIVFIYLLMRRLKKALSTEKNNVLDMLICTIISESECPLLSFCNNL